MAKNIYDKLKRIEAESNNIDVSRYRPMRATQDRIVREFNKGRSFSFHKWAPLTKYSNDDFKQDFVTYNNALLACKMSHESSEPPKLIYDHSGMVIGVDSNEWEFVFASSIQYNTFYFDSIEEELFGEGIRFRADDNKMYTTSEAITMEPITVNIDLGTEFPKGAVIPAGTSVHRILNAVFTSNRLGRSDGISIYTNSMLNAMDEDERPETFISIRDDSDLFETKDDKTYVDILFSAIRSLQAEVAKMRNAFKYGMYSYSGNNTALSEIVDNDVKEKDALWSVDEADLSEITAYNIDFEGTVFPFNPSSNVDISTPGVVRFNGEAEWTDYMNELSELEDAKLYLYMTSNDTDITVNLKSHHSENQLVIKLDDVVDKLVQKYNVILLISRKHKFLDDSDYSGFNYIWVSVTNYENGRVLAEGFYNSDTQRLVKNQYLVNDRYYIDSVKFTDLSLYKFNLYAKYQDLTQEVVPSIPNDTDYKYKVAHITIRSVDNFETLEKIQSQLPNNELIWEEASRKLWIKSKDSLVAIGGNSSNPETNTGMTQTEIIEMLQQMGIVYLDENNVLQLSSIGDATFVNSDTGKAFKFEVNSEGDLVGNEVPDTSLAERIEAVSGTNPISTEDGFRGFISRLLCAEAGKSATTATSDVGLLSDRVKIGAVYCPLETDTKFGCSHGFIELENTSDSDIQLEGVYLHYLHPTATSDGVVEHLPLKGVLKAGNTYLIRCKKYADPETNADVVINVDSFDQEWYIDGELLDLSNDGTSAYGFALTYGNSDGGQPISATTNFVSDKNPANDKQRYFWKWYYIDSLILNKYYGDSTAYWGINANQTAVPSNCIIKNTFELDPAKQAFQALTTMDSSRRRTEKAGNDIQTLSLDAPEISFPNSPQTYPVERFTPKSSKQKKNVSTDKTKLDMEKPNAVSCSFGINSSTTRCFNWVSAGSFDEYVFLKNGDGTWTSFESYKTRIGDATQSESFPRRKEFSEITNNTAYARINGIFPGCNARYTSHKCILDVVPSAVSEKTTYTYIVGRKTKSGAPDFNHCSKEQTFTLYPESYVPRIYQTSDQQGFHWIEYQVWSAAAIALNNKIEDDCSKENIIPILINTGDATQNGTRVNEWLDYFNGGDCLFNHLEQMDVVGNNDLCGANPEILGTGDDIGKSNSFYFHVFHCYDIDEGAEGKMIPIIQTDAGDYKYIPSLYYFNLPQKIRIVMVNSEITIKNCETWFNKWHNDKPVNIYTGWTVNKGDCEFRSDFTTIYTMIYHMLNDNSYKKIVACHEMPFTVITTDNLLVESKSGEKSRSLSGTSLVGSHMNQMSADDKVGIYWFSRLLEHFGVQLCLGGHKHTYASTFPVRENYLYKDSGGNTLSSKNGKMPMEETLANEQNVIWIDSDNRNLSKFPLIGSEINEITIEPSANYIRPFEVVDGLTGGVTYFMCQATGYKLTSNKELPSNYQEFSNLIPETNGSKADTNQQYPMFAIVKLTETGCSISLARVHNIFNDKYKFTQLLYSKNTPHLKYISKISGSRFGNWDNSNETNIINISWN